VKKSSQIEIIFLKIYVIADSCWKCWCRFLKGIAKAVGVKSRFISRFRRKSAKFQKFQRF